MDVIVILGAAAVVCALFSLWWAVSGEQPRVVDLGTSNHAKSLDMRSLQLRRTAGDRTVQPLIERFGMLVRRVLPSARTSALARKIQRSGSPQGWTVERVLAAKVLLALSLGTFFLLRLLTQPSVANLVLALVAALFGYFAPDGRLDSMASKRKAAIRADVSDTIDQICVMVRAGLGIDAAIARVAKTASGPLADEFARAGQDIRVGLSRGVALANLVDRVDVAELRGFVGALAQAEKLGVPVAQTLQLQSAELRIKRGQLAEEQAMKLPVKILFPMVVFILPVIFIVLLGPAAIRIMETFSN